MNTELEQAVTEFKELECFNGFIATSCLFFPRE